MKPTRTDLIEAARLSRLTLPLDIALSIPALAYCLNKTAQCVAKRRYLKTNQRPDFKKLAAGDPD